MHITGEEKLNKFAQRHPNTRSALNRWYNLIEQGSFKSLEDLRAMFPRASPVKVPAEDFGQPGEEITSIVFNIGGNKARLTAFVRYKVQRVIILKVETHAEYSKRR
jgi:mRNA interferase HigB